MLIGKFGKITADGIRECALIEEAARVFEIGRAHV